MRRSVLWSLGGSLALSALALLWPEQRGAVVAPADHAEPASSSAADHALVRSNARLAAMTASTRSPLDKAGFDPFVGLQPPPPPEPASSPAPKPFIGPIYVPPPSPPALNYRYLGQMTDPAGRRMVYLSGGDRDVTVALGTRLDEGYVVEAITAEGIRLHYPALDVRTVIPIPLARDAAPFVASSATP